MKPGGSSAKGGAFERQVCKDLSLWISNGQKTDLFWRSAMSGGRATLLFKKDEVSASQSGDITAIDSGGLAFASKYFIECKHRKHLSMHQIITGGNGDLIKSWEKTCKQAIDHKKRPIMIARQNHMPRLIIMHPTDVFIMEDKIKSDNLFPCENIELKMCVGLFDNFLKKASPRDFVNS